MDPAGHLARLLMNRQVLGAVVNTSNVLLAPGIVRNTSPTRNGLSIGEIDDSQGERVQQLRALLGQAGLVSPPLPSVRKAVWRKLLINLAGSSLCTLARCDAQVVAADPGLGQTFDRLVHEALAVAAALGIIFEPGEVDAQALRQGSGTAHRPSMLQAFERGAALEIDAILRAPQRCARTMGVVTSVLDTVIALLDHAVAARQA